MNDLKADQIFIRGADFYYFFKFERLVIQTFSIRVLVGHC